MMNKKVSVAVGAAAAVAFAGAAMASDIVTINNTEQYVPGGVAAMFVPEFITADCGGYGTTTGSCPDHGIHLVMQAAMGVYWTQGDAVPIFDATEASGYLMFSDEDGNKRGDAFDNGLFRTNGTSYFQGLNLAWGTVGDALQNGPDLPIGAPTWLGGEQTNREVWIDQTVVTYVDSTNQGTGVGVGAGNGEGGADLQGTTNLAQNFRSQLSWSGADLATAGAQIDQRLEQMVELTDGTDAGNPGVTFSGASTGRNPNDNFGEASRQTVQMAFQQTASATSNVGTNDNTTTDPDVNNGAPGGGDAKPEPLIGSLVSQDIEGFFFSCVNCDNEAQGVSHAFAPSAVFVRYQDYDSGWNVVPTVTHANTP